MRIEIEFQGDRVGLEVPDGRLIAAWRGKSGVVAGEAERLVAEAIENPRGYPPLRKAVVPGDRVVIALGADVPESAAILSAVVSVLESAGAERGSIMLLVEPGVRDALEGDVPRGIGLVRHRPDDRDQLAYLANTSQGRRVYLNRQLTDADIVVPVGRLTYDPVLGGRGPWNVIFPGLSDRETSLRFGSSSDAAQDESHEVSWLLGSPLELGLVAGVSGVLEAVAGLSSDVRTEGLRAVEEAWCFRPESRAELVVAGIGRPGEPADVADVARGLATATRLVQRGGKVVVLSKASGEIGPAMRRLIDVDDPRDGPKALRGHEDDRDHAAARHLAQALAWADVYLLSALDRGDVEGLSMIALDRPEQAARLAATSGSCLVLSHADLASATVAGEAG